MYMFHTCWECMAPLSSRHALTRRGGTSEPRPRCRAPGFESLVTQHISRDRVCQVHTNFTCSGTTREKKSLPESIWMLCYRTTHQWIQRRPTKLSHFYALLYFFRRQIRTCFLITTLVVSMDLLRVPLLIACSKNMAQTNPWIWSSLVLFWKTLELVNLILEKKKVLVGQLKNTVWQMDIQR